MNISKKSIPYKIVSMVTEPKNDFCGFVRQFLMTVIVLTLIILVLPFMVGTLFISDIGFGLGALPFNSFISFFIYLLSGYVILGILIALVFGFIFLPSKIKDIYVSYEEKRQGLKPLKVKEPSMLVTWYKAKKGKYCPRITFVDDEE